MLECGGAQKGGTVRACKTYAWGLRSEFVVLLTRCSISFEYVEKLHRSKSYRVACEGNR
jgi:hypothetical protein